MAEISNLLLSRLPSSSFQALRPHLEAVGLPLRYRLSEPDQRPQYAHFMTSGLASMVITTKKGTTMEVGIVGREGIPESMSLLGPEVSAAHCYVQVAGTGLRIRYDLLAERLERDADLRHHVAAHAQYMSFVTAQLSVCNRVHETEQRLARWILMSIDRTQSNEVHLTHEFLAEMLGSGRPSVSLAAAGLQKAGMVEYQDAVRRELERSGRGALNRAALAGRPKGGPSVMPAVGSIDRCGLSRPRKS